MGGLRRTLPYRRTGFRIRAKAREAGHKAGRRCDACAYYQPGVLELSEIATDSGFIDPDSLVWQLFEFLCKFQHYCCRCFVFPSVGLQGDEMSFFPLSVCARKISFQVYFDCSLVPIPALLGDLEKYMFNAL